MFYQIIIYEYCIEYFDNFDCNNNKISLGTVNESIKQSQYGAETISSQGFYRNICYNKCFSFCEYLPRIEK